MSGLVPQAGRRAQSRTAADVEVPEASIASPTTRGARGKSVVATRRCVLRDNQTSSDSSSRVLESEEGSPKGARARTRQSDQDNDNESVCSDHSNRTRKRKTEAEAGSPKGARAKTRQRDQKDDNDSESSASTSTRRSKGKAQQVKEEIKEEPTSPSRSGQSARGANSRLSQPRGAAAVEEAAPPQPARRSRHNGQKDSDNESVHSDLSTSSRGSRNQRRSARCVKDELTSPESASQRTRRSLRDADNSFEKGSSSRGTRGATEEDRPGRQSGAAEASTSVVGNFTSKPPPGRKSIHAQGAIPKTKPQPNTSSQGVTRSKRSAARDSDTDDSQSQDSKRSRRSNKSQSQEEPDRSRRSSRQSDVSAEPEEPQASQSRRLASRGRGRGRATANFDTQPTSSQGASNVCFLVIHYLLNTKKSVKESS